MNFGATGDEENLLHVNRDFVRSSLLLAGSIGGLAVVLVIVARGFDLTGSSGPQGIVLAAALSLVPGIVAEAIGANAHRIGPLHTLLAGLGLRLAPPMAVCLLLAATGETGRQHLGFVGYLLMFYFVTLVIETVFAVRRAASGTPTSNTARR